MKTYIQKPYEESKWEGKRFAQGLYMDSNNSLTDTQLHLFYLNVFL